MEGKKHVPAIAPHQQPPQQIDHLVAIDGTAGSSAAAGHRSEAAGCPAKGDASLDGEKLPILSLLTRLLIAHISVLG